MGILFGLKGMAIAAVLAYLAGVASGGAAVYKLWSLADARRTVQVLVTEQKAEDKAEKNDVVEATADAQVIEKFERMARDVEKSMSDGVCLDAVDASRLRKLWLGP